MKVAIIGAGFTGLATASVLQKKGWQVSVFEASDQPGGLASGFQEKNWLWSLEKHYHHLFASDKVALNFFKELGLAKRTMLKSAKTSTLLNGQIFQLDSALSLLNFKKISVLARWRTGLVLLFLKLWPFGQSLEGITAESFLKITMGNEAWQILWKPLFIGKFNKHYQHINLAWFWARIHARTPKLIYLKGGFAYMALKIVEVLQRRGVKFYFNQAVRLVLEDKNRVKINFEKELAEQSFDQVLFTQTSRQLCKLTKVSPDLKKHLANLDGLSAQTLVLQLSDKFFHDQTYWLNINEKNWPFLAIVEHTNFVSKHYYNKNSLLYVGNYLTTNDQSLLLSADQLYQNYLPYLKKLNPKIEQLLIKKFLFKEPFAQPLTYVHHSKKLPPTKLSKNVFWSSMQHIYPWDRGVNFAIEAGLKVAQEMLNY